MPQRLIISTLILAVVVVLITMANAASALTINNDNGGHVFDYARRVQTLTARGEVVRINGLCASACTLHLRNPRTCVTERAVLAFHAVSGTKYNAMLTKWLFNLYPKRIRVWINANGGLTKRLIVLKGAALRQIVPTCN